MSKSEIIEEMIIMFFAGACAGFGLALIVL